MRCMCTYYEEKKSISSCAALGETSFIGTDLNFENVLLTKMTDSCLSEDVPHEPVGFFDVDQLDNRSVGKSMSS